MRLQRRGRLPAIACLVAVTTLQMLGACGGGGAAATSPSPSGSPRPISIHGEVNQTNNTYCDQSKDVVSHAHITFRDTKGTLLGTATVGRATKRSHSGGIFASCGRTGVYTIEVPKEASYRVAWIGIDQTPRIVSYRDLAAKGFVLDLFVSFNEP